VAPIVLADVVDRADVRVIQPRRRPGLASEPIDGKRIVRELVGKELERDCAPEAGVGGLVDTPIPPRPSEPTIA